MLPSEHGVRIKRACRTKHGKDDKALCEFDVRRDDLRNATEQADRIEWFVTGVASHDVVREEEG